MSDDDYKSFEQVVKLLGTIKERSCFAVIDITDNDNEFRMTVTNCQDANMVNALRGPSDRNDEKDL